MKNIQTMKNIHITRTYNNVEGPIKIGFVQTEGANDYYYIFNDVVDGPYADEGEAFGGWFRANG